jgi:hypothetical protein
MRSSALFLGGDLEGAAVAADESLANSVVSEPAVVGEALLVEFADDLGGGAVGEVAVAAVASPAGNRT